MGDVRRLTAAFRPAGIIDGGLGLRLDPAKSQRADNGPASRFATAFVIRWSTNSGAPVVLAIASHRPV